MACSLLFLHHSRLALLIPPPLTSGSQDGHSVEEFWQKLTKAADGDDAYFGEAFLLQCLAATIDYEMFVMTMRGLRQSKDAK